ncbi:MAG: bifunctional phosphopantothenoylcysteine decarboxylase/phosphopantothenate--cysteine ligase CoaBC [Sphingobacteriaceae bacterium]|nr:bifunctional phosphopantothenoylcysteine decarboxylase/phosphopantothenate--cysteine ligase CoaBC [Sphingobacteriaceae bacterium]
MLTGKKIILGITGSIAAYKTAFLVRSLVKSGAEVRVIATRSALDFVTPLTLSTLSNNPVYSEYLKNEQGEWVNHVEMGLWADLLVIAPATANTLSKMAHGQCDSLLMAVYLSARCEVMFAPAMDLDMYQHPTTRENIQKLISYGNHLIQPGTGPLASGLSGEGRMAEPEDIQGQMEAFFSAKLPLKGKKVVMTAGPTYEAIDPVRFIGNRSTGKMGYALAAELAALGASVKLISGPSALTCPEGVQRQMVESAEEMYEASLSVFAEADLAIFSAAVADFKPAQSAVQKIKKDGQALAIELVPTRDILAEAGKRKKMGQLLVGFALETNNELAHAQDKLKRKNADLIVLNSLQEAGAGFGHDTNAVTLISATEQIKLPLASKQEIAQQIVQYLINRL